MGDQKRKGDDNNDNSIDKKIKMTTNKAETEDISPLQRLRSENWDPTRSETANMVPSTAAMHRVKKDLMNFFTETPPGLFVVPDETDLMLIHAIIVGPMDTPYEGGFFYFILRCPNNYPIEPPRVKLMTTDAGRVRFNPNLYNNGKVCLSILGTWTGPEWSPVQQIASVLVSIQSLMSEKPFYNEPDIDSERYPGDAENYSQIIQHETLRVAVCGMLENECHLCMPSTLRDAMDNSFLAFYDQYVATAQNRQALEGKIMKDQYGTEYGKFQYSRILTRLNKLRKTVSERVQAKEPPTAPESSSASGTSAHTA